MKIGPLSNEQKVWAGLQKIESRPEEESIEKRKDTVEISREARKKLAELADQALRNRSGAEAAAGERAETADKTVTEKEKTERILTPERLAEIRKRIGTGFYDRPEVRDKIIDKLADDIDIG